MLNLVNPGAERERYLPLLLLADESEALVRSYFQEGDLYAVPDQAGAPTVSCMARDTERGQVGGHT